MDSGEFGNDPRSPLRVESDETCRRRRPGRLDGHGTKDPIYVLVAQGPADETYCSHLMVGPVAPSEIVGGVVMVAPIVNINVSLLQRPWPSLC